MIGTLIIENGPLKGRKIPLRGKKTVLGRGQDCDVQILDRTDEEDSRA